MHAEPIAIVVHVHFTQCAERSQGAFNAWELDSMQLLPWTCQCLFAFPLPATVQVCSSNHMTHAK